MLTNQELLEILQDELENAKNEQQAFEIKNIFIKQYVNPMMKRISEVEDKKAYGLMINEFKKEIEIIFENKINSFNNEETTNSTNSYLCDIELTNNTLKVGNYHLLNIVLNDIIDFFSNFNFTIVSGNEVVEDKFNFQNLNIPADHPARNSHDSFFINENLLLRTHCTTTTAEQIFNNTNDDIRLLSYGNVYRNDDDDATHSHQFTQIDFVWIRKDLSLSNLKWIVDSFLKYIFEYDVKTRYRLSFFPFTEPSFEVDISCFKCNSQGCHICKKTGWIEVLGAGMLNQNVLKSANIHNTKGLAGGIGVERIAMLKYSINDIRNLYNNNFFTNKQFKK